MAQSKVALHYYTKEINRDVPIREVISRYTDIDVNVRGNIRCPSPEHVDNKASAHIYENTNSCKCFACSNMFSAIDIVMMNTGCNLGEACRTLIDDFGLSLSQYSNYDEYKRAQAALSSKNEDRCESFPITIQDCELIGLKGAFSRTIENENYESEIKVNPNAKRTFQRPSLVQLWENDKPSIEEMIISKCDELINHYKELAFADEKSFRTIYSLHTNEEWNEAQRLQVAIAKSVAHQYSHIQLTDRQRTLIQDLRELGNRADDIAHYEDKTLAIETVKKKVVDLQTERHKMQEKKQAHNKVSSTIPR